MWCKSEGLRTCHMGFPVSLCHCRSEGKGEWSAELSEQVRRVHLCPFMQPQIFASHVQSSEVKYCIFISVIWVGWVLKRARRGARMA